MTELEFKQEIQQLKAENDRLKKQLSQPVEKTTDQLSVVQQVAGLANGYLACKDKLVQIQRELDTRNEDNRRLQKLVAKLQADLDRTEKLNQPMKLEA